MSLIPILTTMAWICSFLFTIYISYYLIVSLFSLKKLPKQEKKDILHKFAVVIAARNEECVIGQLVESLKRQDYPAELYDVLVVPNNCTDHTAQAAQEAGATVLDCTVPVRSKGEVLSFVFEQFIQEGANYDAVCVFDADNLADPGFLKAMNQSLCSGARAAQGYRDSKNPYDTAVSGWYSIYYWMVNRFYNHTRSTMGLSAMINGSGFMVSMDLLRKMGGWNTVTMTEDIEFTTQCILEGERVEWVPDAITYDEQPLTFSQSWKQRKRWSTGMLQGFSVYFGKLFRSALHYRRIGSVDQMFFFLAPFMQLVYLVSLVLGLVLNLLYIQHNLFPQTEIYYKMFLSMNMSYVTTAVAALFAIILEKKSNLKILKALAGYWMFIMSWIPINILCLFKKATVWEEIKHTRRISISQVHS